MKKIVFNSAKYLLFLSIGVLIFWLLYRKIEGEELIGALKGLKYQWLIVSVLLNTLAQVSRAFRWNMLIKPMGYKPSVKNLFLSILVMYGANLIIPRAGEVARCSVITRTDKIPFTKLVGTVFTERLADVIMLFILAVFIFASNLSIINAFFEQHPGMLEGIHRYTAPKYIVLAAALLIVTVAAFLVLRNRLRKSTKKGKLIELKDHFIDGLKSIARMEKKWLFIGHTVFIFLMWLLMLYVVFLAFEPTGNVSLRAGMVVFLMGGLAMIVPVQGGIGPWHFMVAETLILYGISRADGLIFALIAHTTTNLYLFIVGSISILYLLYKYGVKAVRFRTEESV